MTKKGDVKELSGGQGFQNNPQNINREGAPPKTHWWTTLYMKELEKDSIKREGLNKKESIVAATVEQAEEGSISHIKEVGDRVQGKAPQAVGILDDDGAFKAQNLTIEFVKAVANDEYPDTSGIQ